MSESYSTTDAPGMHISVTAEPMQKDEFNDNEENYDGKMNLDGDEEAPLGVLQGLPGTVGTDSARMQTLIDKAVTRLSCRTMEPPIDVERRSPTAPLERPWVVWLINLWSGDKYCQSFQKVYQLNTRCQWLSFVHNMVDPSSIYDFDIALARKGITPAWEDDAFKLGGRWDAKCPQIRPNMRRSVLASVGLATVSELYSHDDDDLIASSHALTQFCFRRSGFRAQLWLTTYKELSIISAGARFGLSLVAEMREKEFLLEFNSFLLGHEPRLTLNVALCENKQVAEMRKNQLMQQVDVNKGIEGSLGKQPKHRNRIQDDEDIQDKDINGIIESGDAIANQKRRKIDADSYRRSPAELSEMHLQVVIRYHVEDYEDDIEKAINEKSDKKINLDDMFGWMERVDDVTYSGSDLELVEKRWEEAMLHADDEHHIELHEQMRIGQGGGGVVEN